MNTITIGIGGLSQSGKTTLSQKLQNHAKASDKSCIVFHQDDFVFAEKDIPKIKNRTDWECPQSIDFEKMHQAILDEQNKENTDNLDKIIIAEGLLIFYHPPTNQLFNKRLLVEISQETFFQRKAQDTRWGHEPQWYIQHIWDSYLKYGQIGLESVGFSRISGELSMTNRN